MPPDRAGADDVPPPDDYPLDVVGIGSPLVDVLSMATDDELARTGLAKGSMELVDLARAAEIYSAMGTTTETSGGSAANTLAGVAALGGSAGFVGRVADDEFGDLFVHDIRSAGVLFGGPPGPDGVGPTSGAEDRGTGRCLVLVSADAERTMATHLGVASTFTPADVPEDLVARARVLYLEGYLFDLAPAKQAMRQAVAVAHAGQGSVALSLSDSFCVQRHRNDFLELLTGDVDVLFANEDEVVRLFNVSRFDQAVAAVEETGVLAVLTRGAGGSVVVTAAGPVTVPADPVEAVVDTTGAGDLFAAGFLYGITNGLTPDQSARLGGVCAAEVIAHVGARPQADLRALAEDAGLFG